MTTEQRAILKRLAADEFPACSLDVQDAIAAAVAWIDRLESAIREHRDAQGDDRCWLDDVKLYRALNGTGDFGPDMELPPKCDFLMSCARFWEQRQRPSEKNAARSSEPERMTLAQLQAEVERLRTEEAGRED